MLSSIVHRTTGEKVRRKVFEARKREVERIRTYT